MDLDFPNIHVPFRTFTAASLGSGHLPLWVSDLQFGLPYLANGDTAVLYPLQLPFLLMSPVRAIGPLLWLHVVLTMLTMYTFLKVSLGLSRNAAMAGAIIFGLNGFFLVHLGLLGLVYAQPWVPLMLLGLERAINRSIGWAVLGGLALAVSILAGHPQQMFFCAPAILVFLVVVVRNHPEPGAVARLLRATLVTLVVGIGLAAIQILPQAELVSNSHRSQLAYEDAVFGSIEARKVWTILLPDFWRSYTGEAAGWVGVTGVLLAVAGIVFLFRTGRIAELAGWLTIVLSSLVFSVGGSTPVYRIMLEIWPGLDHFRFPLRFLYPAVLGVSALAAYGVESVTSKVQEASFLRALQVIAVGAAALILSLVVFGGSWEQRGRLWVASAMAVTVGAAAVLGRRWMGRQGVQGLLMLAVAFELISVSSFLSWNNPSPVSAYEPGPIRAYLETHGGGRLVSVPAEVSGLDQTGILRAAVGNAALLSRIPSVESFGGQWPPKDLEVLQKGFTDKLRQDDPGVANRTKLFNLLAVEYVVAGESQKNLAAATHLRPIETENGLTLYHVAEPGPRVRTYCGANFSADPKKVEGLVLGEEFDPSVLWIGAKGADDPGEPCGEATRVVEEVNSLDIEVNLPQPGWVFVADTWYPGWTAEVDGHEEKIERAQGFFRAVRVPEGNSQVRFSYRPKPFRLGLAVSIFTLAGLLSVMSIWARRAFVGRRGS